MSKLAEPKFGLKTFCPSSCHFYGHHHIEEIGKVDVSLFANSSFNFSPILARLGRVYHSNTGGDLRWLVRSPLNSFRRNRLT